MCFALLARVRSFMLSHFPIRRTHIPPPPLFSQARRRAASEGIRSAVLAPRVRAVHGPLPARRDFCAGEARLRKPLSSLEALEDPARIHKKQQAGQFSSVTCNPTGSHRFNLNPQPPLSSKMGENSPLDANKLDADAVDLPNLLFHLSARQPSAAAAGRSAGPGRRRRQR